jgi:hypothetical protein
LLEIKGLDMFSGKLPIYICPATQNVVVREREKVLCSIFACVDLLNIDISMKRQHDIVTLLLYNTLHAYIVCILLVYCEKVIPVIVRKMKGRLIMMIHLYQNIVVTFLISLL